jgi:hypothetical protein
MPENADERRFRADKQKSPTCTERDLERVQADGAFSL